MTTDCFKKGEYMTEQMNAKTYNNRGNAKGELGDYEGAVVDWSKTRDLRERKKEGKR